MKKYLRMRHLMILFLAIASAGMGSDAQYDQEARENEKLRRQLEESGELEAIEQTDKELEEALHEAKDESADQDDKSGLEKRLTKGRKAIAGTFRGAVKAATFGAVEDYEVVEPAKDSEDTGRIRIKIPGT